MDMLFYYTRQAWSGFWLGVAVLILIPLTSVTMLFMIPIGLYAATIEPNEYALNVWLAFDKLWNAVFNGDHEETFSSRIGKIETHKAPTNMPGWLSYRICWMLDKVDKDHCKYSIDWRYGWKRNGRS